jgi:hypothetical protein
MVMLVREIIRNNRNPRPTEVLVFSTSVQSGEHVRYLTPLLNSFAGQGRWNFALDDSDRILRIVSSEVKPLGAVRLLQEQGFECKELKD